jgi:hypothetical protein
VFDFDDDQLIGERVYMDFGDIARQLAVVILLGPHDDWPGG